ncbi:hypothetical protein [uncultured Bacteroides sp.]|uniref:hypothetical protein n=1 Tax=uncultured Bacteroides sp. TaxID=162156 RepID=UPI00266FB24D|nr:hypothetical protein [uncultured Bacteroides sp.]
MENQIKQLVGLFSNNGNVSIHFIESWDSVDISIFIILDKIPDSSSFLTNIPLISDRDSWEFKILDENDETILTIHSASGEFSNFDEIEAYKGLSVSIRFIVTKEINSDRLSIYSILCFNKYLGECSLYSFLNALNKRLNNTLILECINDEIETLNTESISVVSKNVNINSVGTSERMKRIRLSEGLIHWGAYKLQLLPEDIYPSNCINPLHNIFEQASACLLMMYLFDHISITSNSLDLELSGFKTLSYTICTSKLSGINVDQDTVAQLFQVYCWGMSGGYVADKFSIARNILSLNLDATQMRITSPIINAIKSNFRVYEKENVQQYIQLRNEISNLLIDLQAKINDIAQNFTTDFKNNLLVLVSFFASVIVFGVISEASPIAYFSNHIIILSWCFLLISFFYWLYSYSELNKKTKLFYKHYEQIKNRYKALLDDVELKNIFEECNPDKYESHQSYIKWQKLWFSTLWIASIITLFIGLSILFVFNNTHIISIIKHCNN